MKLRKILPDKRGKTVVEYSLILVMIAIGAVLVLKVIGGAVNNTFKSAANAFQPGNSGTGNDINGRENNGENGNGKNQPVGTLLRNLLRLKQ